MSQSVGQLVSKNIIESSFSTCSKASTKSKKRKSNKNDRTTTGTSKIRRVFEVTKNHLITITSVDDDKSGSKKSKREDLLQNEDSTFESFIQRTANIPQIWENIMSEISVTDVARSMRVSRSLRSVIGQCLDTNSTFKCKMNLAATVSAAKRMPLKSTRIEMFNCTPDTAKEKFALDGTYYCAYRTNERKMQLGIKFLRQGMNASSEVDFQPQLLKDSFGTRRWIRPICGGKADTVLICGSDDKASLLHLNSGTMCKLEIPQGSRLRIPMDQHCVRHFLTIKGDFLAGSSIDVLMHHLRPDGQLDTGRWLYRVIVKKPVPFSLPSEHCNVFHAASNEEAKFAVLTSEMIAVHDAITGDLIWKRDEGALPPQIPDDNVLYITKTFTVYLEGPKARFFDTTTGVPIGNIIDCTLIRPLNIKVRGPYLCWIHQAKMAMKLHVIKIISGKLKEYAFTFPLSLAQVDFANNQYEHVAIQAVGFLGKSNVLIGALRCYSLRQRSGVSTAFSIDLDAATSAKDESQVQSTFSVLFPPESIESLLDYRRCRYVPMFKTDISQQCVDMIGVMATMTSKGTETTTVKTHMFITEIQCSSIR